jgi:hypothetical protein
VIVVVEGISAAGKTAWCARHASGLTITETPRQPDAPDPRRDPQAAARIWTRWNATRWQAALASTQASPPGSNHPMRDLT